MYLYVITYQTGGQPEDIHYFKGLYKIREGEHPIAMFGNQGKPKVFRRDKAARKALDKIMQHGGFTNIGYTLYGGDMNLKIKEIDLNSNYISDHYY